MNNNREIKFQRVLVGFTESNDGKIEMREWGPYGDDASFKGPAQISGYKFVCDRQYTGLKDTNGKEIYEGDVLQSVNKHTWLVSWNDNHACFMVTNLVDKHVVSEVIDNDNSLVIGNIYENPELLK